MTGQHPFYYVSVETNVTDIQPQLKGQMAVDLSKPYFRMYAVHGRGKYYYIKFGHSSFLFFLRLKK